MLVIHTETKDLTKDMNTIKKVKKVTQSIREINFSQEIQIAFSGIINPVDNNFAEKIDERNTKLESYCKSKGFVFIKNLKLDSSSLNKGRLHLNGKGTGLSLLLPVFLRRWFIKMVFRDSLISLI